MVSEKSSRLGAARYWRGHLEPLEEDAQMLAVTLRGLHALATLVELLTRVSSRGIQQPITHRDRRVQRHERFLDERCDDLRHLRRFQIIACDGYRVFKRKTADEDRDMQQHHLFPLGEQVVTPVECRAECLMPRQRGAASPPQ